jgi:hypothetical protein
MKVFNLSNTGLYTKSGEAVINIGKTGYFILSSTLSAAIGVKGGDRVNILQSEKDPLDIYISPTKSDDGFLLFEKDKKIMFTNSNMAKIIREEIKLEKIPFSLRVITSESLPTDNGEAAYLLITSKPIIRKKNKNVSK